MSEKKFSNMKLMFLILRKNTKLLNEFIYAIPTPRIRAQRRSHIIFMKNKLAELSTKKYNLLKTIATNVNRFDILKPIRAFDRNTEIVKLIIPDTEIVIKSFYDSRIRAYHHPAMYGSSEEDPDPRILHDKILNHYFILESKQTTIQEVVLFGGNDHLWFEAVYDAIKDAKDAEEEILKQQKIMEEMRILEKFKEGILDKYS
jgi:hypothetical protein